MGGGDAAEGEAAEGGGFNVSDSIPSGNALRAAAAKGDVGNFDCSRLGGLCG